MLICLEEEAIYPKGIIDYFKHSQHQLLLTLNS